MGRRGVTNFREALPSVKLGDFHLLQNVGCNLLFAYVAHLQFLAFAIHCQNILQKCF